MIELIRFMIWVLVGILAFRLLKVLLKPGNTVKRPPNMPRRKNSPFDNADIQDVDYEELPPESPPGEDKKGE